MKTVSFSQSFLLLDTVVRISLVGIGYRLILVNYSNLTSPGDGVLINGLNLTILNLTRGAVVPTSIIIR